MAEQQTDESVDREFLLQPDAEGKITCPFCGHKWTPVGKMPKQCPACKRYLRTYSSGKNRSVPPEIRMALNELQLRVGRLEQTVFSKPMKINGGNRPDGSTGSSTKDVPNPCKLCWELHKDGIKEHCLPVKIGLTEIPEKDGPPCKYFEDKSNMANDDK